jgi:Aspartyl protease
MSSPRTFPLRSIRVRGAQTVRASLPLELRRGAAATIAAESFTKPLLFRVDCGADVTMMSTETAQELGLVVPEQLTEIGVDTAGGSVRTRVRVGLIIARIPDITDELFFWPCHFWESWPAALPPVLGMAGVVNASKRLRLMLDGTTTGGHLIVEVTRGA